MACVGWPWYVFPSVMVFWAGYNGKLRKGFLLTGKLGNWNFINWEMRIQYMVKLTGNWENENLTGNQCTYTPFLYSVVEFYNFSFLAKAVTFYFSILKCLGYQYVEPWSLSYFTFSVAEFGRLCTSVPQITIKFESIRDSQFNSKTYHLRCMIHY